MIIRAEIRRWRRRTEIVAGVKLANEIIEGYIYKDVDAIYDDGEHITIIGYRNLVEASTFYLVETHYGSIFKLEKDERE